VNIQKIMLKIIMASLIMGNLYAETTEQKDIHEQKQTEPATPMPKNTLVPNPEPISQPITEPITEPISQIKNQENAQNQTAPLNNQELANNQKNIQTQAIPEQFFDKESDFDENAKRKSVINLIDRGVAYFNTHLLTDSCNAFSHTQNFVEGELYLFLYSFDGAVFAHGQQVDLLWKNLYNTEDDFGTLIVQSIIKKARDGGGWVTYKWRNATKVSYVKEVQKDGKSYVIGTGYYPHSKIDAVVNLTRGAVAFFNKTIKDGRSVDDAFSPLSYPIGKFVYGDLYLYALNFQGVNLAHGNRPGLIGTNSWDYKDAQGVFVNQEIIKKLNKTPDRGVWMEYISGGAPKRAYVEKVKDKEGNPYFIACGYYPDADKNKAENLVRKGYQFMKMHGLSAAEKAFDNINDVDYRYGDLHLFVYDTNGKVLAYGGNTELVGQNHYNYKDQDGKFYVQDLIKKAENGGGWINIKMKNSFKSIYVEKVELGGQTGTYIIGSGVYPISKNETMELLAKSGADYLASHDFTDAFAQFANTKGRFIRGDLNLFVFDTEGICYVYGNDNTLIWRKGIKWVDDNNLAFVQEIISKASSGPGIVEYKLNKVQKNAYVKSVQKENKTFIVGSSYFK